MLSNVLLHLIWASKGAYRADMNRVIVELPLPAQITRRAKELRERTSPSRAMRADAASATIGIITFGHAAQPIFEALTPEQQDAAYLEVAERIADEYGPPSP